MPFDRKNIRLSPENYLGPRAYFVTICCDKRQNYLAIPRTADRVIALLRECTARHSFALHAYCLMPDHLHLLAEGNERQSDLLEMVRVFKLRTAFEFRKVEGHRLWEMSFYDHILRPNDVIENVACYIWWNPVRKGLCSSPHEFPYSGSQTIPWISRASPAPSWSAPWKPNRPI
ncbi:MAG TPA: transposase [Candidatus Acidoferrum sp.]|nr:transposase [Candidatus Acidoferrum sp.]